MNLIKLLSTIMFLTYYGSNHNFKYINRKCDYDPIQNTSLGGPSFINIAIVNDPFFFIGT